jgi:subtilisin family serine protease
MSLYRFRHLSLRTGTSVLAVAATVAAGGIFPVAQATGSEHTERVIIELEGAPALDRLSGDRMEALRRDTGTRADALEAYRSVTAAIEKAQDDVAKSAESKGVRLTEKRHITGVLNALVADVAASDITSLRELPGVARVTKDARISLLATDKSSDKPTTSTEPVTQSAGEAVRAETADPTPAPQGGLATDKTVDPDAAHGEGTTVAILDTGVDYTLADLGAGFGDGFKVVGGYDFANDDADPMDDHYHGTHVAGIVAGTGAESVTGVAPAADLTAYKVLDFTGSGWISWALGGLEAAADPTGEHPADIINMSLGMPGDGTDPVGVAATNATKSGVLVVAAAGNEGPSEATIGSPAAADGVLAVGASITDFRFATATLAAPEERELATWRVVFSGVAPAEDTTAPIVDVADGSEEAFASAGDITGKVVAYRGWAPRNTLFPIHSALVVARRAEERGAIAALVYERSVLDEDAPAGPSPVALGGAEAGVVGMAPSGATTLDSGDDLRLDSLVVFGMSESEYETFAPAVMDGSARMTLSSLDATDHIASFSSRGPTTFGTIKPEIVAPGYQIRSTVPASQGVAENAYRASGTSMASPHVAGVAALVHAQHPALDPAAIRARLIGSAVPLASDAHTLSPSVQGAGRASAAASLAATVVAAPDTLAFGQADADGDPSRTLKLELSNTSDIPLTGHIEAEPSAGSQGTLSFDGTDITVAPGATASVAVTATATVSDVDTELSGVVVVRLSDGTEVRVPFLQMSRRLGVTATPAPSTDGATVLVSSFLPLEAPPILTITGPTGEPFTVPTTAADSMPGWYKADIARSEVGVYGVSASGEAEGRTIAGTGTFEVIPGATSNTTWQQLGRDASSKQLAVSMVAVGTAMQTTTTSVHPFVTTNHGATWRQVGNLPVAEGTGTVIADPTSGTSFWYAVNGANGQVTYDPTYHGKLLRTEDLGATWAQLPLPDKHIQAIATEGQNLAVIFTDGVEISRDGGKSWIHSGFAWPVTINGATIHRGDLFVSGGRSVWRVADVFGQTGAPTRVHALNEGHTYGIASNGDVLAVSRTGGAEVSTDSGDTWKASTTIAPHEHTTGIVALGNDFFMGGLQGYFHSRDGGETWVKAPSPIPSAIPVDFDRWPDRRSSLLIPLEQAGLFESRDDGKSFERIGVSATSVASVIASSNAEGTPTVFIADEQGSGSRPLSGRKELKADATEWGLTGTEVHFGVAVSDLEQDATSRNSLWRVHTDGNRFVTMQASPDGGSTWNVVGPRTGGTAIHDLEASPTVSGHLAASFSHPDERGVAVTHDAWQHWEVYNHPVTIQTLAIDPHDESRLWLATDQGLYRSDDEGRTIRQVLAEPTRTVWVDPRDSNRVLAGGRGLWQSNDGGGTFSAADAGGADMYVTSFTSATVAGDKGGQGILFAGTTTFIPGHSWVNGRGVLASRDGGKTWSNVSAGLAMTAVTDLDVSDDNKWLLAGTRSGGLYRADIKSLIPLVE